MIYKRICIICGKKFETFRSNKQACSKKCYTKNYTSNHKYKLKQQSKFYNAIARKKIKLEKEAARLAALARPEPPKFDIDKWDDKSKEVRKLMGEL